MQRAGWQLPLSLLRLLAFHKVCVSAVLGQGPEQSEALIPDICETQRFGIVHTWERGDVETARLNSILHGSRLAHT